MIRGAIFSIDSMLAFVILMITTLAFLGALSSYEHRVSESSRDFYLEEKTILASDSFVKNYSPQNSLLGSAFFDFEKKRVKSNEINSLNFASFRELEAGNFFVKQVRTNEEIFYESNKLGVNCLSVKRFVLLDSIKKIIIFTGCLTE